jgi:hypothetical protein
MHEELDIAIPDPLDVAPTAMFYNDETTSVSDRREHKRSRCMHTDETPSEVQQFSLWTVLLISAVLG